jgi:hypothetical protein
MQEKVVRIPIGKGNCLNDIPVHLDKSLTVIINSLQEDYKANNLTRMLYNLKRLQRVTKDLEDMAHELKGLEPSLSTN